MRLFGKYAEENLAEFSVREIKFARARLSVLLAFSSEIRAKNYEEIRIRDLCRLAEISEPSFYNYFPRKDDLFLYFISLWSVDVQLHCLNLSSGVKTIYEIFRYTALQSAGNPGLLKEIIAYQARTSTAKAMKQITPVTLAEKSIVFGNVSGLADFPDQGLGPVLSSHLQSAVDQGELPKSTSPEIYSLILGAVFFGVPVIIIHNEPDRLAEYYEMALNRILPVGKNDHSISFLNKKNKKRTGD